MPAAGIDRHHARAQQGLAITYGVHRRHRRVEGPVPREEAHRHRCRERGFDFGIVGIVGFQHPIPLALLLGPCHDGSHLIGGEVLGKRPVWLIFCLGFETRLEIAAQMLGDGLFGISLHAGVDGGVDFESVGIEIIRRSVGLVVFVAPAIKRIGGPGYRVIDKLLPLPPPVIAPFGLTRRHHLADMLPEIGCHAGFMVDPGEMGRYGKRLQRVTLGERKVVGLIHLVEDNVAAFERTVGIKYGVVDAGVLAHAHQHGSLLDSKFLGALAEVDGRRRLQPHGLEEEVELVEVHVHNLFLGVEILQLHGYDPLDGFLEKTLLDIPRRRRIEQLGQLLGNGATAAGALLPQQSALDNSPQQSLEVDSRVFIETHVFGGQ